MKFAAFILVSSIAAWGGESTLPRVLGFRLNETPQALSKVFGSGPNVVRQSAWQVLQFHDDAAHSKTHSCDGGFEWEFFYDRAGQMQSVTWNADKPVPVEKLFPAQKPEIHSTKTAAGEASVLVRHLPDDRLLIANVSSPDQAAVSQVTIMRSGSLKRFLPWLAAQLEKSPLH